MVQVPAVLNHCDSGCLKESFESCLTGPTESFFVDHLKEDVLIFRFTETLLLHYASPTHFCRTCHRCPGWIQSDSGRFGSCGRSPADRCPNSLQPSQTGPPHMHGCALNTKKVENKVTNPEASYCIRMCMSVCVCSLPGGWRLWW